MLISNVCEFSGRPTTFGRAPTIHAAEPRNHRGQRDFPKISLVATWIGPITANNRRSRRLRMAALNWELSDRLAVAVERDAVKLHAMVDEAEAELLGDALLKKLQFLIDELDDRSRLDVDQMVVMRV